MAKYTELEKQLLKQAQATDKNNRRIAAKEKLKKQTAKKAADSIKTDTVKKTDKALGKDAKMLPKSKTKKKLPKISVVGSTSKTGLGVVNDFLKNNEDNFSTHVANNEVRGSKFIKGFSGTAGGLGNSMFSFPDFALSKISGKDVDIRKALGISMPESTKKYEDSKEYKVGNVIGNVAGFAMQSAAAAPAVDKLLANTKLGQMAANAGTKLANTGVGRLAGEEAAKRFTTGLARNAVEAGTIGLGQNIGMAAQEGLTLQKMLH